MGYDKQQVITVQVTGRARNVLDLSWNGLFIQTLLRFPRNETEALLLGDHKSCPALFSRLLVFPVCEHFQFFEHLKCYSLLNNSNKILFLVLLSFYGDFDALEAGSFSSWLLAEFNSVNCRFLNFEAQTLKFRVRALPRSRKEPSCLD